MYNIIAYSIYLLCSIVTVFLVGKILHRHGKVFLFGECPDQNLAYSSNNFLYLCYCLINTAFALFFLPKAPQMKNLQEAFEFIIYTQGIIFTSLGCMHVVNVLLVPRIITNYLNKKLLTHKN